MKTIICAALAACSLVAIVGVFAVAGEPQQGAAPPVALPQIQLPQIQLPPGVTAQPDSSRRLALDPIEIQPYTPLHIKVRPPGSTCYFIRTLRPLSPPEKSSQPHFVPLTSVAPHQSEAQARVAGTAYGPDCTRGGELIPVPVKRLRPDTDADASGPALVRAVDR